MHLTNKVILLTGASQGIGRATAIKFVEAGCRVGLVARSEDSLRQLADQLGAPYSLAIPADLTDPDVAFEIVKKLIDHFGRIDILVNNAAIGHYGPSARIPLADIETVMATNFLGPISLMQACISPMQTQGGGLIINVSSIIGRRSVPWSGTYCASKAALEHLVESLRVELATQNIRFSTLYPGVTQTNFAKNTLGNAERRQGRIQGVPAERVAAKLVQVAQKEPRDAYVTLFDYAFVTGSRLFPRLVDFLCQKYFVRG